MKASIVIAVLDSHEIVRRQVLYWNSLKLPDTFEVVLMDDGSYPSLTVNLATNFNLSIHKTNDFRQWTQPLARNKGVELSKGEYVICTDIDHIISKEAIELTLETDYDVIRFKRYVGILDERGKFSDSYDDLELYGFSRDRGKRISAHGNSYIIKRDLFLDLGGSQQKDHYPNQDEVSLKRQLKRMAANGDIKIIPDDDRPPIYLIPNGRYCGDKNYNPFGLFHTLQR